MEGTRDCSCGGAQGLSTQSSQVELKRWQAVQDRARASGEQEQNPLSRHREGKQVSAKHMCGGPVLPCKRGCQVIFLATRGPLSSPPPMSPYPGTSFSLCKAQGSLLFPILPSHILSVLPSIWRSYRLMPTRLPLPVTSLLLLLDCSSLGESVMISPQNIP